MDNEINAARHDLEELLGKYKSWSGEITQGHTGHSQYVELIDFVNFRMETVDSCRILLGSGRIADTLGLNRSLLENYLLHILMCRGTKYIRLGNFRPDSRPIDEILNDERQKIGTGNLLGVEPYPKLRKHLLYIFEGLRPEGRADEPPIPFHHFLYREFRPNVFRLDEMDYFQYYEPPEEVIESEQHHRRSQRDIYNLYLSYDAVMESLRINEIIDRQAVLRINAHYTFLGTFVHPTSDSFRDLHDSSNQHSFRTEIGFNAPYAKTAHLMGYIYTLFNAIGIIEEATAKLKAASSEYIIDSGTTELNTVITRIKEKYTYFWYIFNSPSDYDKFNYCVNRMGDTDFEAIGRDYKNVNPEDIPFNKEIYGNLQGALSGWSNVRVGSYVPPYAS